MVRVCILLIEISVLLAGLIGLIASRNNSLYFVEFRPGIIIGGAAIGFGIFFLWLSIILKSHEPNTTNEKIIRYQLQCSICMYVWDTRYPSIPAKCPSCNINIYGTNNYHILKEYYQSRSCFIATAAFGTPFVEEIEVLREWRDKILLKSFMGRTLINGYYKVSPPIANAIVNKEKIKFLIRQVISTWIKYIKNKYMIYE